MRTPRNALLCGLALGLALTVPRGAAAQSAVPASPHGTLPAGLDCGACHTAQGWTKLRTPMDFDHDKATRFLLDGRHSETRCAGCHLDLRFDAPRIAPAECGSCHLDVHQGRLDGGCISCHNATSFQDAAGLDRHTRTQFPLTGAHIRVSCNQCHAMDQGGVFSPLDSECLSCHRADYERGHEDPGGGTFDTECQRCHQTSGWRGVAFDHAALANGFALEGRHQVTPCEGCHLEGGGLRFQAAGPTDCSSCHQADYDSEHRGTGFPTQCVECHTADGWERGPFDHGAVAGGYQLIGRHSVAACSSCHMPDRALRFHPSDNQDCVACHRTEYDQVHAAAGYPVRCAGCHTADGWARSPFDHAASANGFALLGGHRLTACTGCHIPPDFAPRFTAQGSDDCISCHRTDYDREHSGTGFPTTCLDCHNVNDWDHAVFDHLALSGYALVGAHAAAPCASCHNPADNALLFPQPSSNQDCVACHQADYDAQHGGTGFPTTCLSCHSVNQWAGATFNHDGLYFPIYSGKHNGKWSTCQQCHPSAGNYAAFTCMSSGCHSQTKTDNDHSGVSGYAYDPVKCLACHPNGN